MAVSFVAGHLTLANWGFSAGDIAVLAGAGRAAGTWLVNQLKDQSLLEFMRVDPGDLIPRKGLIDPTVLHKRWDVRLTLLQNGTRRVIGKGSGTVVESMSSFSWFMTLIASALDATFQKNAMRTAMSNFLSALFEEHVDGLDYLRRELPYHIQGWISAAVVRNILGKARAVWKELLEDGTRLPGDIPGEDIAEIVRFLTWIAGAKQQPQSRRFETTSSDVLGFAIILHAIGFEALDVKRRSEHDQSVSESVLVVIYTPGLIASGTASDDAIVQARWKQRQRVGVSIPLNCMEECVSVWPGSAGRNMQRRQLFKDGIAASKTLSVTIVKDREGQVAYKLKDPTASAVERSDPAAYRLVFEVFPVQNPLLLEKVSAIIGKYPDWIQQDGVDMLRYACGNQEALSQIQIFILGYFYGLTSKVLDSSQLSVAEAYGTWKWFDAHTLYMLSEAIHEHTSPVGYTETEDDMTSAVLQRAGMLKMIALLYAGADEEQVRAIDRSTLGVHGKITTVAACLLAATNSTETVGKFYILDTDSTAIPSNARGLISSGPQVSFIRFATAPGDEDLQDLEQVMLTGLTEDFTSHIEPDWDHDLQQCQIVFRFKGRIVARLAPVSLEAPWTNSIVRCEILEHLRPESQKQVYVGSPERITLNRLTAPNTEGVNFDPTQPALLLPLRGLTKARICFLGMYSLYKYHRTNLPYPLHQTSTPEIRADPVDAQNVIVLIANPARRDQMSWHPGTSVILA